MKKREKTVILRKSSVKQVIVYYSCEIEVEEFSLFGKKKRRESCRPVIFIYSDLEVNKPYSFRFNTDEECKEAHDKILRELRDERDPFMSFKSNDIK